MATVGIRELKHGVSDVLRRVRERGEEVDVTYHGRVIARIVPVRAAEAPRTRASWRAIDELAREIAKRWPGKTRAARAVRETRRG